MHKVFVIEKMTQQCLLGTDYLELVIESVIAPTTLAVLRPGYFNLFSSQLHSVYIFIRD